jgi:hypothetical protein
LIDSFLTVILDITIIEQEVKRDIYMNVGQTGFGVLFACHDTLLLPVSVNYLPVSSSFRHHLYLPFSYRHGRVVAYVSGSILVFEMAIQVKVRSTLNKSLE